MDTLYKANANEGPKGTPLIQFSLCAIVLEQFGVRIANTESPNWFQGNGAKRKSISIRVLFCCGNIERYEKELIYTLLDRVNSVKSKNIVCKFDYLSFDRRCNHDPTHRVCAKIGLTGTSFWEFTGQDSWCGTVSKYALLYVFPTKKK